MRSSKYFFDTGFDWNEDFWVATLLLARLDCICHCASTRQKDLISSLNLSVYHVLALALCPQQQRLHLAHFSPTLTLYTQHTTFDTLLDIAEHFDLPQSLVCLHLLLTLFESLQDLKSIAIATCTLQENFPPWIWQTNVNKRNLQSSISLFAPYLAREICRFTDQLHGIMNIACEFLNNDTFMCIEVSFYISYLLFSI